jgi:acyl-CoA synthetase (AMP-forming)/AMP-acid ligase II
MLPEIARQAARRFGDRPAMVAAGGWTVSYRRLDERSDEVAVALTHRGIAEGDLVTLVLPSTPDYVVAYLAAAKLGAVTSGVNPSLTPSERGRIVGRAGSALVLAHPDLARGLPDDAPVEIVTTGHGADELLGGLAVGLATGATADSFLEMPVAAAALTPPADPDRPVAVVWTSGTTGEPKGAVFCEAELTAIAARDLPGGWDSGGPSLASTQFAHVGFMTKLPWMLMSGGTLYLLDRWRAADALALVAEHRMTSIGGVAPQVALMLRDPDFDSHDLSSVRAIIMGGGPSSPALVEEARRRFGAAYSIRYSSTESGGIATATAFDADDEEALHTVGRPRPGVYLEIRDEHDRAVPDGEVGEVVLRSPTMMRRYWQDPEATARTLVDGWLHTGDLGWIDERGLLRLTGRADDMYVRGGYNVYPMEVEAVLATHPAVQDIAVVARPDDTMGQVGVAVVVPRDPAESPTAEDLAHHAGGRLARHKLPADVVVVDALPLTAMNKVDRRALTAAVVQPAAGDDT